MKKKILVLSMALLMALTSVTSAFAYTPQSDSEGGGGGNIDYMQLSRANGMTLSIVYNSSNKLIGQWNHGFEPKNLLNTYTVSRLTVTGNTSVVQYGKTSVVTSKESASSGWVYRNTTASASLTSTATGNEVYWDYS